MKNDIVYRIAINITRLLDKLLSSFIGNLVLSDFIWFIFIEFI